MESPKNAMVYDRLASTGAGAVGVGVIVGVMVGVASPAVAGGVVWGDVIAVI
jgi:hypothetical protein